MHVQSPTMTSRYPDVRSQRLLYDQAKLEILMGFIFAYWNVTSALAEVTYVIVHLSGPGLTIEHGDAS